MSAIHDAVRANNLPTVQILLRENPTCINEWADNSDTPVLIAVHSGYFAIVQYLVVEGSADLSLVGEGGSSPIHQAILGAKEAYQSEIYESIVRFLIDKGAPLNAKDNDGHTPLYRAITKSVRGIARILLDGDGTAEVNVPPYPSDKLPLHKAIEDADYATIDLLLEAGARPDRIAVWMAVNQGNLKLTGLLLQNGGDPNEGALHEAANDDNIPMLELLLQHKADINARDDSQHNRTPLHMAALSKYATIRAVSFLINKGAKTDVIDDCDWTPMALAAVSDNIEKAEIFLSLDLKPCDELLLAAVRKKNAPLVQRCLDSGCNMDALDYRGNGKLETALHFAVQNEDCEMVDILLKHNANPNLADDNGDTPVHVAAMVFETWDYTAMRCAFTMDYVDDWKTDGPYKGSAAAAERILQDCEVDLDVRNKKGKTPLKIALEQRYYEMVRLLREYGEELDADDISLLKGTGRLQWFESLPVHYPCAEEDSDNSKENPGDSIDRQSSATGIPY